MQNVFGDKTREEASEAGRGKGSCELGVEFALVSETAAGVGYV